MQYGVMNNSLRDLRQELELAGRGACDYVEIALDAPEAHYSKVLARLDELLRCVEEQGLAVVCHLPTFVSLADLSPHIREASVQETMCAMEAAVALKAVKAVLHPPFYTGMGRYTPELSAALSYGSLDTVLDKARELGLPICLENLDGRGGALGTTPESMGALLKAYPAANMVLDVAHAYIAGGFAAVESFCAMAGSRLKHVHVSDNFGHSDDHLPLGAGGIDWPAVVRTLKRHNYEGTVTFEVFAAQRNYRETSMAKFKALWDDAGTA